ncbi:KEOPS complex N(6)-L-threonylcarbamoyladenine synthase Kae1 [Sulfurisphaera tokodaii]|uniref:tRNA N6-adenosine threonylcarbamoyltransferase n=2 Tax=Sulfurisphaera tokodaii TaxID=111955 RepID=KAE1_SULTO|nr:KEOPS complex N(6)-L-threonylcarbamoyladenine synthase Kae1 [Sulfurisphaera tokodaii]Q975Q7.1 RecName: Full=tRNA N6-adenosine threonylcarbamoyltransferase; AltName: Full=N6-L-threonylcarbamoyladenine synthase; Short=t(6)A synthase; AltName: Full=t(6)A37 threonylcarbamoyladenosine biosynthesis protein Kae1; AltName: Full=tRNA threonylcarbamoyladenosine biosynthesis protein Kae1 [Sulfurisphaera tokodaii str. 7]BAK54250.1 AP (apurinic) lyase [Sulfurisphaera tokodaii str. 7]HII74958.1 N(6)-L-thre
MNVLGIESTAHTFGVGIVSDDDSEIRILSNERDTFVPKQGGMKPSDLGRHHSEVAPEVLQKALIKANLSIRDINYIAVSLGPGIGPALRVGATIARALSLKYDIKLVPVNHGIAHIEIGRFTTRSKDPLILYLSGGNTIITTYLDGKYRIFGETLDIALGNMLDTFVREVGLAPPYIVNGVHQIDLCANKGGNFIELPYIVKGQDMSYSGLLTAALRATKNNRLEDVCYSVREVAFDMLLEATERALALTGKKEILVVGGVAASVSLKTKLYNLAKDWNVEVKIVPPEYSGDNGAMIAFTGLLEARHGVTIPVEKSIIRPRWRVDQVDVTWRLSEN